MQPVNDERFYRSNNRILGGVCAGLAERFHIDPLWVRVTFVILVFMQGVGLFVYVVLWLVMPERIEGGGRRSGFDAMLADLRRVWGDVQHQFGSSPQPGSSAANAFGFWQNQSVVLGVILVVVGLVFLGGNIGIINWSVVWPAALITLGIVILVRNLERRP